jgi:flagellar biosynthesis/type III secretory pathway M-ring protein FliF/YscJ
MNWLKIWDGVKSFFYSAWVAIKKLPHWAIITFLVLFSVVWWLIKKSADQRKLVEIQREVANTEKDRAEAISDVYELGEEEEKDIKEEHDTKLEALREEEKDILDAASEGPVAIASEWKDFLLRKKDEK